MQDFAAYINSELSQGEYIWQCVANSIENIIFLDLDSE